MSECTNKPTSLIHVDASSLEVHSKLIDATLDLTKITLCECQPHDAKEIHENAMRVLSDLALAKVDARTTINNCDLNGPVLCEPKCTNPDKCVNRHGDDSV